MPFRKISRDLKLAAVRLHEEDLLPQHSILDALSISRSTFYRILNLWQTTGDVVKHRFGLPGRPRILHFDDLDYLLRLIRHNPDYFLDELLCLLQTNRFILNPGYQQL
jgi:transposase